jgi:hypothetical protein
MARVGQFPGHANNGLPAKRRCGGSLNFRLGSGPQSSSPLLNSQGERDDFTDRVGFGQSCVSEE